MYSKKGLFSCGDIKVVLNEKHVSDSQVCVYVCVFCVRR